jgi:hypothetical protein
VLQGLAAEAASNDRDPHVRMKGNEPSDSFKASWPPNSDIPL